MDTGRYFLSNNTSNLINIHFFAFAPVCHSVCPAHCAVCEQHLNISDRAQHYLKATTSTLSHLWSWLGSLLQLQFQEQWCWWRWQWSIVTCRSPNELVNFFFYCLSLVRSYCLWGKLFTQAVAGFSPLRRQVSLLCRVCSCLTTRSCCTGEQCDFNKSLTVAWITAPLFMGHILWIFEINSLWLGHLSRAASA